MHEMSEGAFSGGSVPGFPQSTLRKIITCRLILCNSNKSVSLYCLYIHSILSFGDHIKQLSRQLRYCFKKETLENRLFYNGPNSFFSDYHGCKCDLF